MILYIIKASYQGGTKKLFRLNGSRGSMNKQDAVYGAILAIIAANGIPEAIVAAVLTTAVCKALHHYIR